MSFHMVNTFIREKLTNLRFFEIWWKMVKKWSKMAKNRHFFYFFTPKFEGLARARAKFFYRCSKNIIKSISVNIICCYNKKQQKSKNISKAYTRLQISIFVVFCCSNKKKLQNFFSTLNKIFWTDSLAQKVIMINT